MRDARRSAPRAAVRASRSLPCAAGLCCRPLTIRRNPAPRRKSDLRGGSGSRGGYGRRGRARLRPCVLSRRRALDMPFRSAPTPGLSACAELGSRRHATGDDSRHTIRSAPQPIDSKPIALTVDPSSPVPSAGRAPHGRPRWPVSRGSGATSCDGCDERTRKRRPFPRAPARPGGIWHATRRPSRSSARPERPASARASASPGSAPPRPGSRPEARRSGRKARP